MTPSSGSTTNLFGDNTNITDSMFIARDSFQYYVNELPEAVKNSAMIQSKISEINLLFEDYMRKIVQEKKYDFLQSFGTNIETLLLMMIGVGFLAGCMGSLVASLAILPVLGGIAGVGYLGYKTYLRSRQSHDDMRAQEEIINKKVIELQQLQRQQRGLS